MLLKPLKSGITSLTQQPPPNPPPPVAVVLAPTDGDSSVASFGSEGDRIIEELVTERAAESLRGPDSSSNNNNNDDDSASTCSMHSLNSEEAAILAQVEAEMEGFDLRDHLN
jgi:hypothetical protein